MRDIHFKKEEDSRLNSVWLVLMYMSGDADTHHPKEIKLPFEFSHWRNNIKEIEEKFTFYKTVQDILENNREEDHNFIEGAFGKLYADAIDAAPRDTSVDYQYKCYLADIYLIGYDMEGNKLKAYL